MEKFLWMIVPAIGGLILFLITSAAVKAPGKLLQNKFATLTKDTNGVIAGKTYGEIVAVCGQPNSNSAMGDGTTLKQWQATGYHVALLFDKNDVCIGISSEIKV